MAKRNLNYEYGYREGYYWATYENGLSNNVKSEFMNRRFNPYRYDSWMHGFEDGVRDSNALKNPKYTNELNELEIF